MTTSPSHTGSLIPGASASEQRLYDHLLAHIEHEREALRAYEGLVASTGSTSFAYLARMILEDERRHHELLGELAETIRVDVPLTREPRPIPTLVPLRADRDAVRQQTEHLLALEREDNRALDRLARELKPFKDTTVWELVVRMLQADNDKHQMMLRFIARRAAP